MVLRKLRPWLKSAHSLNKGTQYSLETPASAGFLVAASGLIQVVTTSPKKIVEWPASAKEDTQHEWQVRVRTLTLQKSRSELKAPEFRLSKTLIWCAESTSSTTNYDGVRVFGLPFDSFW